MSSCPNFLPPDDLNEWEPTQKSCLSLPLHNCFGCLWYIHWFECFFFDWSVFVCSFFCNSVVIYLSVYLSKRDFKIASIFDPYLIPRMWQMSTDASVVATFSGVVSTRSCQRWQIKCDIWQLILWKCHFNWFGIFLHTRFSFQCPTVYREEMERDMERSEEEQNNGHTERSLIVLHKKV